MSKLMAQLQCNKQTSYRTLMTILQLLFAVTIFNIKFTTVCATMNQEMIVNTDDATSDANAASYASEKRSSWQSLQGPWGKRTVAGAATVGGGGGGGAADEATAADADDDVFLAEHWAPMLMNNGDRTDPIVKYTMIYLTNTATLDRLSQQKQAEEASAASAADGGGRMINEALLATIDDAVDGNADRLFMNEKRSWKNMNAAWGKRRNAPTWNKFGGAWGKREPGWNNLKGMWGKRASKDWQKLNGGWGKRADIN